MIQQLFSIMAPLIVCAGVGFFWQRSGRPFDSDQTSRLLAAIAVPALVFSVLSDVELDVDAFGRMAGAAVAALVGSAVVGAAVLRAAGLPLRTYLAALTFPNVGNMGLPLNLMAFGEEGLRLAMAYFVICSIGHLTVGTGWVAGGGGVQRLVRLPVIYAVVAAVPFAVSGHPSPRWLSDSAELLGQMAVPLMLIALGVSLARLRIVNFRRSLALSLLRLSLGFGLGVGLAWLLGLEGAARGVVILQSSMPAAVYNYLLAERYRRAPEEVAGMVVLTTILSFATLPALLAFVL